MLNFLCKSLMFTFKEYLYITYLHFTLENHMDSGFLICNIRNAEGL